MWTFRNKIIGLGIIILACIVFTVFAADNSEIDISQLKQGNPFAQFAGAQAPPAVNPETPKPDLVVETVTLKFLDAKSLKSSIAKMSSDWGSIETDSKTNSLIVCDSNENLEKILKQVRKVDRRPDQIMIEVVILDIKLTDDSEIGVNWDFLTSDRRGSNYRQSLGYSNRLQSTLEDAASIGAATAWNTTGTGGDFSLLSGDIRNVIHMIQSRNDVEIIASPRVLVVSGETASVESVEEVPYTEQSSTSEGGNLTSTSFKNIGVTLNVSATLTEDNFILLTVESEQSVNTGDSVDDIPIVDSRKVASSLLLEDGQIVAFGGLRKKETKDLVEQLPFLGDLPVVGFAFKSTKSVENNSELLVMLAPHIYKGEKLTDAQKKKYDEIINQPLLQFPDRNKKKDKKEKSKTGWLF